MRPVRIIVAEQMGLCCNALALLGQAESAKGWMSRALLIEPDNANMRYNFACTAAGGGGLTLREYTGLRPAWRGRPARHAPESAADPRGIRTLL